MSAYWASNFLPLPQPTKFFTNKGSKLFSQKTGSTFVAHNKSQDHSGIFTTDTCTIVCDGFAYNSDFVDIAKQITNSVDQVLELLNTFNAEYSMFIETDSFYAVVTDPWRTKNVYVNVSEQQFIICNAPDMLEHAYPVDPNTMLVIHKNDFAITKHTVKHFDLSQTDSNHNRVFDALEKSLKSRFDEYSMCTLSSGYDSGVISCALANQGHTKFCYSFVSTEDKSVLAGRLKQHNGIILPEQGQYSEQEQKELCDLYWHREVISEAGEAQGRMCRHMKTMGKTSFLLGNGGDELYSDYGYNGKQLDPKSVFGGKFPRRLETVWPWHNFENKCSMLVSRSDHIAGYYGLQHKEPLLDVDLVQAWLNTTSDLKNQRYKNWMWEYMHEHNYPMCEDVKIGFGNQGKLFSELG